LLYMNTDTRRTNAPIRRRDRISSGADQHAPQSGERRAPSMNDLGTLNGPALDDTRRTDWGQVLAKIGFGLLTLCVLVGGWWMLAVLGNYPPYILPTPPLVAERAWEMVLSGSLIGHFWTTFLEAGLGFLLALVIGVGLGYPIAHSRLLEKVITPYIGISQGLPVVALAPFLVIWFKDDLMRNIIVVTLIVFLPLLVNTIVGLRNIDRSMLEVARISGANLWQTIWYVELPLSLRALLGGVKLGVTLSITGAVVGELISANSGLGFLLAFGRGTFDIRLMFVGLVSLALLTMVLYAFVTVLEKVLIDSD
jgi:NitT/TauT family transport system permease protein